MIQFFNDGTKVLMVIQQPGGSPINITMDIEAGENMMKNLGKNLTVVKAAVAAVTGNGKDKKPPAVAPVPDPASDAEEPADSEA